MKKLLTIIVCVALCQSTIAQSVSYLSYQYIEIISYSIKITYSGNTYYPSEPYGSNGNIMGQLQARYDRNTKMISDEWGKVEYMELINWDNKAYLEKFKKELRAGMPAWQQADFSIQTNVDRCLEYITQIYNDPSIRAEIKLLQRCNTELNRIKYTDPNNYPNSKRYKSINKVLNRLADCNASEISSLNWEAYEVEDSYTYNSNSSSLNNAYVNSETLKVRSGASTNSSIIKTLSKGDEVEVIETVNSSWTKVKVKYYDSYSSSINEITGYVYSEYITKSTKLSKSDKDILNDLGSKSSGKNHLFGEGNGKLCFYSAFNAQITVYVDGRYIGILTSYFNSGSPECDNSGVISLVLSKGYHTYKCSGGGYEWSGSSNIEEDQSVKVKIGM